MRKKTKKKKIQYGTKYLESPANFFFYFKGKKLTIVKTMRKKYTVTHSRIIKFFQLYINFNNTECDLLLIA